MDLTKFEALGNDFLLREGGPPPGPEEARARCDRRRGVGADGLLWLEGARVHLWNADGSPAGFSGNGVRCAGLARALATGQREVRLEMGDRAYRMEVVDHAAGHEVALEIADPAIVLRPPQDGDLPPADLAGLHPWVVDVGNPHLVLLGRGEGSEPPDAAWMEELRRGVPFSPGGVNVTWLAPAGPGRARARTHERGVGPTEACASGSLAAYLAAREAGILGGPATLELPGGELGFSGDRKVVRFSGPVRRVFEARIRGDATGG